MYKTQIRPYLEYAALIWMSSVASYLRKLEKVERHAMRLVDGATPHSSHETSPLDPLEH